MTHVAIGRHSWLGETVSRRAKGHMSCLAFREIFQCIVLEFNSCNENCSSPKCVYQLSARACMYLKYISIEFWQFEIDPTSFEKKHPREELYFK